MSPGQPAAARRSWFWLQGMIAGGIAVAAPGIAIAIAVLLLPALLCFALDQGRLRTAARAMLLMGLACSAGALRRLWDGAADLPAALELLADPATPIAAWCGCGAGWLTGELAEAATILWMMRETQQTIRQLQKEREALLQEWDGHLPGATT